jgi:hypothetical protein
MSQDENERTVRIGSVGLNQHTKEFFETRLLMIAEDHQNDCKFYEEIHNLVEVAQFPNSDVLQRIVSYTGEEILPTKESVLEELKRRVVYHGKENQVHRRLLDIVIHLPEEEEEQQEQQEEEVQVVKEPARDNEQSVISVNSSTTASFDTQ